jgi:hypothetical protein
MCCKFSVEHNVTKAKNLYHLSTLKVKMLKTINSCSLEFPFISKYDPD